MNSTLDWLRTSSVLHCIADFPFFQHSQRTSISDTQSYSLDTTPREIYRNSSSLELELHPLNMGLTKLMFCLCAESNTYQPAVVAPFFVRAKRLENRVF